MLKLIYDALWYPAAPVAALALEGLDRQKLKQRLGWGAMEIDAIAPRVWLHAASVGEVEGARPIALGLLRRTPRPALLVTCMTETGCQAARNGIPGAEAVMRAPLDCPACVRSFLRAARPRTALIAETELWPNYLLETTRAGISLAIINARLSERSFVRYRALRSVFVAGLKSVTLLLAQSGEDAERYALLGVPREKIMVVGNPKFDLDWLREPPRLRPQLEAFLRGRRMLVAGSTAPGEEAVVTQAYRVLRGSFADLALALAPRHPRRAAEVEGVLRAAGLDYVKASELGDRGQSSEQSRLLSDSLTTPTTKADLAAGDELGARAPVLLLDTLGELRALYFCATLAFVGGSLWPGRGGQSLAEPAAAALPVMFGPYHESQRMIAQALLRAGAGLVVRDAGEIVAAAAPWLSDARLRRTKGALARAAVEQLGGAVERSLMALSRLSSLG